MKFLFRPFWRLEYKEEPPAAAASGEPGAPGSGAGGGSPESTPTPTPPVDKSAEFESKLKSLGDELAQYKGYYDSVSSKIVVGEDGKITVKEEDEDEGTKAVKEQARVAAQEIFDLSESSRKGESTVSEKFKSDPLFSMNMTRAKQLMETVRPQFRTEKAWERFYNMARGENLEKYQKMIFEKAKGEALTEYIKQGGVSIPSGKGAGGEKSKLDISTVNLSPRQMATAQKMVESGMINSIDEYKKNMLEVEEQAKAWVE